MVEEMTAMRVALLTAMATGAMAQGIEARATGGVISFADDGTVNQATAGGSVRFYFSRRWSVEPQLMYARRTISTALDSSLILWGNVQLDILRRERRASPYWFVSPGVVWHTTRFGHFSQTNAEAAIGTGAGVRIRLSDRVFVAPQARLGIADGIFAEVTGSIGFVLK
jgi:hypothetical protein